MESDDEYTSSTPLKPISRLNFDEDGKSPLTRRFMGSSEGQSVYTTMRSTTTTGGFVGSERFGSLGSDKDSVDGKGSEKGSESSSSSAGGGSKYFTRSSVTAPKPIARGVSPVALKSGPPRRLAPKLGEKAANLRKKAAAWMPRIRRGHIPYILGLALVVFVVCAFFGNVWFRKQVEMKASQAAEAASTFAKEVHARMEKLRVKQDPLEAEKLKKNDL